MKFAKPIPFCLELNVIITQRRKRSDVSQRRRTTKRRHLISMIYSRVASNSLRLYYIGLCERPIFRVEIGKILAYRNCAFFQYLNFFPRDVV
uniref:Uncharacterized protein n=1 Tax=Trichogramma kaykai TaxID=54128 RepID=A0ABD2WQM7_9HYME